MDFSLSQDWHGIADIVKARFVDFVTTSGYKFNRLYTALGFGG